MLPLFEKYKIPYDKYTYQNLNEILNDSRDISRVFKLVEIQKKENIDFSFMSVNNYLECAIRALDKSRIVEALLLFKKIGRQPKNYHLKKLSQSKLLPDEIRNLLVTFENKFGKIKNGPIMDI